MSASEHKALTHSPLGKSVDYESERDANCLFAIPRANGRDAICIATAPLPFIGCDLWNAYELSWLDPLGKPVVALGQFRFPAESPNLVESKSLKLYLNAFNQRHFESVDAVARKIADELSAVAGSKVDVTVTPLENQPQRMFPEQRGILLDNQSIAIDTYDYAPEFLQANPQSEVVEETLYSHLLKSNCLVTGQPDWGSVYIRYRGPRIDHAGLLRYIVSFRRHNEFHEQCVERIFHDLQQRCAPESLAVWARYTRRGGLDINPFRSSGEYGEPENGWEIRQ